MKLTGNTILVTGGGSGIGRGLAVALQALGNRVIIGGRRAAALEQACRETPGLEALPFDVDDRAEIARAARELATLAPALNMLINNAGIQRPENLLQPAADGRDAEAMILTNLLGPMRMTAALLPALQRQADAVIMNVSSALAFVPLTTVPTYSATKAALHSWTVSLRHQLRDGGIQVIELIPPYVQTDLGPRHGSDPAAMPLREFITETMALLQADPTCEELVVQRSRGFRSIEDAAQFARAFGWLN